MAVWAQAGDVLQANQHFTTAGRTGEVVFHFQLLGGSLDDGDRPTFTTSMDNQYFSPLTGANTMGRRWTDLMSGQAAYGRTTIWNISRVPRLLPWVIGRVPVQGRRAGEALPPQSALMVRTTTNGPARTAQGRKYFGGLSELDQEGGNWNVGDPVFWTGVGLLASSVATVPSMFNSAGQQLFFLPVVYSRKVGSAHQVQTVEAITVVRTQRRRAGRLGPRF